MRRVLGCAATALILVGAVVGVPAPAQAAPARPPAGTIAGGYVALRSPVRVVDTRTGLHHARTGPLRAGSAVKVRVTGRGTVPRHGVAAVVVSLRALRPTASGGLVAYGSRRPATTSLRFVRGVDAGAVAVSPVSARGRIAIRSQARHGTVQVAAEVIGYYRGGRASNTDHGVFHALPVARRVLVRTVPANAVTNAVIGGRAGVPSSAGAVAATVSVLSASRTGSVSVWRQGDPATTAPTVRHRGRAPASGFAVLGLGGGKANLRNGSARPVRIAVDVVGYYTEGVAQTAGAVRPLPAARVLTRTVGGRRSVVVSLAGRGGVPLSRVTAAVVGLDVIGRRAGGTLQVARYRAKQTARSAVVTFRRGVAATATTLAPLSRGRFALRNTGRQAVRVTVTVTGYVPADTVRPPATYVGRYPNQLTGDTGYDTQVMRDDGRADARRGSRFVLPDLGAQTVTGPITSRAEPGIVLALTKHRVAIKYTDVVTDIAAYLDGYASIAPRTPVTVAVGTNNDGVWDPKDPDYYAPAARGRDFADRVIDPLRARAPAGVSVLGADDIEAGFASDQYQALAWENAYLAATGAGLVFNGSLDGCPTTFGGAGACSYGWTQAQYVALTTNRRRVLVLPQIYIRDQSIQWANIDRTSRGSLHYAGVLTESLDPDTFTAPQGWTAFVRALSTVRNTVPTGSLRSVDIQPDSARR